jgi:hypothetical protein
LIGSRNAGAAAKIQRTWRAFVTENGTSSELAKRFEALRPKPPPRRQSDDESSRHFDAFATAVRDERVLCATRAFFARVARTLDALERSAANAAFEGETAIETSTFARILSSSSPRNEKKTVFPAREVMCAYGIAWFPEIVLGAANASEARGDYARALQETARETRRAVDAMVRIFSFPKPRGEARDDDDLTPRAALRRFASEWRAYTDAFAAWKSRDASTIERELTRAAVEMETSARRVCGASTTEGDFAEGSDARAILEALASDLRTLRGKVRGLTGARGVERFQRALRDARQSVREEQEILSDLAEQAVGSPRSRPEESSEKSRESSTAAARRVEARETARAARLSAYATRQASNARRPTNTLDSPRTPGDSFQNEALMHELLVDPEWRLESSSDWNERAFDR